MHKLFCYNDLWGILKKQHFILITILIFREIMKIINKTELKAVVGGQLTAINYSAKKDVIVAGKPGSYYRIYGESHNPVMAVSF